MLPENTCSDLICHFDFPLEPGTVPRIPSGTVLGTQSLLLAIAMLSRELGENSLFPHATSPSKPSYGDIRHTTDPVHSINDHKMANVWTIILNISWN